MSVWKFIIAGSLTGLVNGFFGGGGGCVLVPLLTRLCALEPKKAFATSVAVVLPLCLLSVTIYILRGELDWREALPYLAGGTVGGWLGGKWFRGMNVVWLRRIFGALLVYGGVRCFW